MVDPSAPPRVLAIGGHDPSGGAGVDADREAIFANGCAAEVVVTAHTDQDDSMVRSIGARSPADWSTEAARILETAARVGTPIAAIKFGLLPGLDHIHAAAEIVRQFRAHTPFLPVVVDPVIESSSGCRFLDPAACDALLRELLPLAPILTPNLPEAARLTGHDPELLAHDAPTRLEAARGLLAHGAAAVLLKGGHGPENEPVTDLLLTPAAAPVPIEQERVSGPGIRGSGCRHASALASSLAHGTPLPQAAHHAAHHVAACIRAR